jgi:hypothetical protein
MDPTKEQYQISCQSRKKCDEDPGNDKTSVRGRKHELYMRVWMACSVQGSSKKVRQVKSKVKTMPITFFDIMGSVHKEFILTGQTVNFTYYCGILG